MSKAISVSTRPIFTIFLPNGRYICVNFLDPVQFFRFLKGRCHDNQFFVVSKTQTTCYFCNFIPYESVLGADDRSEFFSLSQLTLPWQPTEVSQDPLDRFSQSLHRTVGIELQMINTFYFFRYLKGRCHGNQLKSKNWRFYGPIYFVAMSFGNGLQYRNSDFKRLDRMNISTSCAILVTFCPETSEFSLLTIAPFVAIWQKSAYYAKYLRMFWTYLDLLYRFGRRISGDDFPQIHFAAAQGTLLWQPVKCERRSHTSHGMNLLFALAFDNGLADRKSAFKRFNAIIWLHRI